MRKLKRWQAGILVFTVLDFVLSLVISASVAYINLGPGAFPNPWLHNWSMAFLISWPCVLVMAPIGQRVMAAISE